MLEVQDHIELIMISDHAEGEVKAGDRLIGIRSMTVCVCECVCVSVFLCMFVFRYGQCNVSV